LATAKDGELDESFGHEVPKEEKRKLEKPNLPLNGICLLLI